jgi:hypothetical protein
MLYSLQEYTLSDMKESGSANTSATGYVPQKKDQDSTVLPASDTEFGRAVFRGARLVLDVVSSRTEKHGKTMELSQMGAGCLSTFFRTGYDIDLSADHERQVLLCAMIDHKEQRWLNDIHDLDSLLDGIAYRCALLGSLNWNKTE